MRMLVHGECIGATHSVHVQQQRLEVSMGELLSGKREVRGSRAASKYAVSITSPRTDRVQYIYVRESRNRNHGRRPLPCPGGGRARQTPALRALRPEALTPPRRSVTDHNSK
jgi:hypothetical protein